MEGGKQTIWYIIGFMILAGVTIPFIKKIFKISSKRAYLYLFLGAFCLPLALIAVATVIIFGFAILGSFLNKPAEIRAANTQVAAQVVYQGQPAIIHTAVLLDGERYLPKCKCNQDRFQDLLGSIQQWKLHP